MPRHYLWFLISCMALWGPLAPLRIANAQSDLAKAAQAVLKERCFSCHGEGGANEGGFNYALNRKRLAREMIVPGDADESKLFQRVVKGEMPPDGDKLPPEEIETLKQWIEADAPAFSVETKRPFVSPADMLVAMSKDLEKANERDRPFYRYFTLTHLYNAGFDDNELESYRQGLSKLVNSLSWGREVVPPLPIDADKTILRIDLRKYKWNENDAWSRIIAADPYHVTYTDRAATTCYKMTKSDLPHVRADWFVFAASRPPLYNVILGLPDTPEQMLKFEKERLGVDVARNLQDYNDVLRAGFNGSGVSKNVRLIERHVSSYGAYWKSYDFKPNDPKEQPPKRRSLKATPTGPGGPNGFEHDGGEMIFNLPNGLQGYMLTDATGKQIPKGPPDVVVDREAVKRGRDPEVVNGVSCMNCHWSGMLNKSDQIRDHVLSQPANYNATVIEFVTAVYADKAVLSDKLKEDRERFEAAVLKCGLPGLAKSEPVATLAFQFDEPLDIDLAAAEAGVSIEAFTAALRNNSDLGRELGSLPQGQPVQRDAFVPMYESLIKELRIGTYHSPDPVTVPLMTNTIGMQLALIPSGEFRMGSTDADVEAVLKIHASSKNGDLLAEQPQHRVRISKPFYLGVHEVTRGQFAMFVKGQNYQTDAEKGAKDESELNEVSWKKNALEEQTDEYPVTNVSWNDAMAFCQWLSKKEGQTYQLPSEAQWEYACRAGTTSLWWHGANPEGLAECENVVDGSLNVRGTLQDSIKAKDGYKLKAPVGRFRANAFGLYDMCGNVGEWCLDGFDMKAYIARSKVTRDPLNVNAVDYRVVRGGAYGRGPSRSRSACRAPLKPAKWNEALGFRVSRTQ